MASSVIFVGSPEKTPRSLKQNLRRMFIVSPNDVAFRIFASFIPPVSKKYQKVYVDLQGPLLALLFLVSFINYGYSFKTINVHYSPTEAVLVYTILMPFLSFILCKLGSSSVTLYETTSLIGYAMFGHVFTLLVSFLCYEERSNAFFFVCLIFFGGLSTLRVALVLLGSLAVPAARLLVCSVISTANILFVVFLHFTYMHRSFIYNKNAAVS